MKDILTPEAPKTGVWYKQRGRSLNGDITHTYHKTSPRTDRDGKEHTVLMIQRNTLMKKEEADQLHYPQSKTAVRGYVVVYHFFAIKVSSLWVMLDNIHLSDLGSDFQVANSNSTKP